MGQEPGLGKTRIRVRVKPKASKSEVIGFVGDTLEIRIAAPPVKGAANAAIVDILAKSLKVRKADIAIVSGATSRNKLVSISSLSEAQVRMLLCCASE